MLDGSNAGVSYTYDGNGLRVKKSSGTLYWRAFSGDVLAETDTAGNTTKEYIYFAGRQVAWRDSAGNVYYEFADMLGSTRAVTTSTGTTCFDTDYYPYGQEMDHTSTCPPTYRFTGGVYPERSRGKYDSETGNYYAFFRYFSPRLSRFMTADPLGGGVANPQSLNRYSGVYPEPAAAGRRVANNPANATDPLGLVVIFGYDRLGGGGFCPACLYLGTLAQGGIQFGSNFNEFEAFTPTAYLDRVPNCPEPTVQDCGYTFNVPVYGRIGILEFLGPNGDPQGPQGPTQPKGPTDKNGVPCDKKTLERFNAQFHTNFTMANLIQFPNGQTTDTSTGTANIRIGVPAGTFPAGTISTGRFGGGELGVGSTLHVVSFTAVMTAAGVFDVAQAHLDQGNPTAFPFLPGAISHLDYVATHSAGPCP